MLKSVSNMWFYLPLRIQRSKNQRGWIKLALTKFLLPVPVTLCSAILEMFIAKGGMFPSGDTGSIELEVGTTPYHFGHHVPLN